MGLFSKKSAPQPSARPAGSQRWVELARCYGLIVLSSVLMFLGFAGFRISNALRMMSA